MGTDEAGSSPRILFICGSRKPAPGVDKPSAARELLRSVAEGTRQAGAEPEWLDLRELDLPFFDGRAATEHDNPDLSRVTKAIAAADVLVLSVPAYWGAPAGTVKNLLDLIGGPAYDAEPGQSPPLSGKVVALLIVGADDLSAGSALSVMRMVLGSLGAWTAPDAMVIGNPRKIKDTAALIDDLKSFGRYVATIRPPGGLREKPRSAKGGLPKAVADELATRILSRAVELGALPSGPMPDWKHYSRFRDQVRATFEVPQTTITPLMARVLYGIAALARPRRILGVGTYAGNTLVWLSGPGFGPDALYRGERALGVDVDAAATTLATDNFRRFGADERVELWAQDGHRVPELADQSWDLILLDADDPVSRKQIYLTLLDALYPTLTDGGLLLAHDICVPLFSEQMAAYQGRVRDTERFAVTMPLEIDSCGLELSVKSEQGRKNGRS